MNADVRQQYIHTPVQQGIRSFMARKRLQLPRHYTHSSYDISIASFTEYEVLKC